MQFSKVDSETIKARLEALTVNKAQNEVDTFLRSMPLNETQDVTDTAKSGKGIALSLHHSAHRCKLFIRTDVINATTCEVTVFASADDRAKYSRLHGAASFEE